MNRYAAYYMVTRDDFCLRESVWALIHQGVLDFFFFVPVRYWDGETISKKDKREISAVLGALKSSSVRYRIHVEYKTPVREKKGNYAHAEALFRNYCLRAIERRGLEHVLVVDGDEFWRAGALKELDAAVTASKPHSATLDALPVAGFPGYPVEGKMEGLMVYIKSSWNFLSGRTPVDSGHTLSVKFPGVVHFTSTRKTREETVWKHLKSCHYGESAYDFDGWIRDKLPKLKPGEKDCHMFKGWQVWPEMRYFTKDEWDSIPLELRKYLGRPQK